jgi:hypothetical protein
MGLTITNDHMASLNIDFMFSMLLMMVILISMITIAEERFETVDHASESEEARFISEKIAKAIEESYSGGEGHEVIIEMPSKLHGSDYKVEVNQSGVLVRIEGRRGYSFSYIKRISNYDMTQYEVLMLPERTYKIRNVKDSNNCHRVIIF